MPQVIPFGLLSGRPTVLSPVILAAWSRTTTDATTTELTLDGASPNSTNRLVLPADTLYVLDLTVIGRSSTGVCAMWRLAAAVKNTGGTLALVGSVATLTSQADAGASGWTVAVSADDTNDSVKLDVTGAAATTIAWKASATVTLTA